MAINPPSDIVLDVARAADPARWQAAADKLVGAAGAKPADAPAFASFVEALRTSAHAGAPPRPFSALEPVAGGRANDAYRAFEAFFLQSFIQSMLPKHSEATYGSGTAGDIWRSMSAEQIGNTIADAGGIGIAEHLLRQAADRGGSATRQPGDGAESLFSLASLGGSSAFQDWSSYLPFLDRPYLRPIASTPLPVGDAT